MVHAPLTPVDEEKYERRMRSTVKRRIATILSCPEEQDPGLPVHVESRSPVKFFGILLDDEVTDTRSLRGKGTATQSNVTDDGLVGSPNSLAELRSWLTTKHGRAEALNYRSIGCLSSSNPLRLGLYNIVHSSVFEGFILLCILVNCVFLALSDPTEPTNRQLEMVELVFACVFTVEMGMKIVALGFIGHRKAYLRSRWNILDALIVFFSWLALVPTVGNYSALRAIRMLRPLRSMNAVVGMKIMVIGLAKSFLGLVNVLLLTLLLFFVAGILGVQLFGGLFRRRCMNSMTGAVDPLAFCKNGASLPALNATNQSSALLVVHESDVESPITRWLNSLGGHYWGTTCSADELCVDAFNPNFGATNFDHVGTAFLVVFQCITFEGWYDVLLITYHTMGQISFFYFFPLLILGGYFLPNLVLAVISDRFAEAQKRVERRNILESLLEDENMLIAEMGDTPTYVSQASTSDHSNKTFTMSVEVAGDFQDSATDGEEESQPAAPLSSWPPLASDIPDGPTASPPSDSLGAKDVESFGCSTEMSIEMKQLSVVPPSDSDGLTAADAQQQAPISSCLMCWESFRNMFHVMTEGYPRYQTFVLREQQRMFEEQRELHLMGEVKDFEKFEVSISPEEYRQENEHHSNRSPFTYFILLCIVLNVFLLGAQHFNQPQWLTDVIEVGNLTFGALFITEMLLRWFGAFRSYFRDPFNIFDCIINAFSLVEFFLLHTRAISVFRGLRILRVLKVMKNAPKLRQMIHVVLSVLMATFYLNLVLLLVLSVSALLGMQLFGGKMQQLQREGSQLELTREFSLLNLSATFNGTLTMPYFLELPSTQSALASFEDPYSVRSHFDNFLLAFYSAFQIVSRDQWVVILWDALASKGINPIAASVFVIVLVLLGNYVIVNLFLAQLVGAFASVAPVEDETTDHRVKRHQRKSFGGKRARHLHRVGAEGSPHVVLKAGGKKDWEQESVSEGSEDSEANFDEAMDDVNAVRERQWVAKAEIPIGQRVRSIALADFIESPKKPSQDQDEEEHGPMSRLLTHSMKTEIKSLSQFRKRCSFIREQPLLSRRSSAVGMSLGVTGREDEQPRGSTRGSIGSRGSCDGLGGILRGMSIDKKAPQMVSLAPQEILRSGSVSPNSRSVSPISLSESHDTTSVKTPFTDNFTVRALGISATLPVAVRQAKQVSFKLGKDAVRHYRDSGPRCQVCQSRMTIPLPTPPLIPQLGPEELHYETNRCHLMAARKAKEKVLRTLIRYAALLEDDLDQAHRYLTRQHRLSDDWGHATALHEEGAAQNAFHTQRPPSADRRSATPLPPLNPSELDTLSFTEDRVQFVLDQAHAADLMSYWNNDPEIPLWEECRRNHAMSDNEPEFVIGAGGRRRSFRSGVPPTLLSQWDRLTDEELPESTRAALCKAHRAAWSSLKGELKRQWTIVHELRIGESQIGGALLTYTHANKPEWIVVTDTVSLFLFPPDSPIRIWINFVVGHQWFNWMINVMIFISCAVLALDNPLDNDPATTRNQTLRIISMTTTSIFVGEILMKIVAQGFVLHKQSFLRDPWNVLDFVVVLFSAFVDYLPPSLSYTATGSSREASGVLIALRSLRALRPLRVVRRNRELRLVIRTLVESSKGIINVIFLATLNYVMFGIFAVQLMSGGLWSCNDPSIKTQEECTDRYFDFDNLKWVSRLWQNSRQNYDHIGSSMLALFEVSAGEWVDHLHVAMSIVGVGHSPRQEASPWLGLFFVIFFVVGNFFLMNLFIGVVIHNFNRAKNTVDGLTLVTEEQRLWIDSQRLIIKFRPTLRIAPPVYSRAVLRSSLWAKLRLRCYYITDSIAFEVVIVSVIVANVCFMAVEHYGQGDDVSFALEIANYVFVSLYLIEVVIRLIGNGLKFFNSGWNQYTLFIVVAAGINLALVKSTEQKLPVNFLLFRVVRIFRLLRILRLVESTSRIRSLLETIYYSMPSLVNISGFLMMVFFMYAVLGMQLFGGVRPGTRIADDFANFRSFTNAIQLLFVFMTGEEWNLVMYDAMVQAPDCGQTMTSIQNVTTFGWAGPINTSASLSLSPLSLDFFLNASNATALAALNLTVGGTLMQNSTGLFAWMATNTTVEISWFDDGDCGTIFAPLYFLTFVVVSTFVISDLFVAVVLDTFDTTLKLDKSDVRMADLHRFVDAWSKLDPDATMLIDTSKLPKLLTMLSPPLGIALRASHSDMMMKTGQYQIADHGGQIHFFETLIPLARLVMQGNMTDFQVREETERWRRIVQDDIIRHLAVMRFHEKVVSVDHYFCATYIAAAWRRHRAKKLVSSLRRQRIAAQLSSGSFGSSARASLVSVEAAPTPASRKGWLASPVGEEEASSDRNPFSVQGHQ